MKDRLILIHQAHNRNFVIDIERERDKLIERWSENDRIRRKEKSILKYCMAVIHTVDDGLQMILTD